MALDIKQTLRERGMRQREVATRLGVSDATISLWAKALRQGDFRRVPAEFAKPLAEAVGVAPCSIRPDLWQGGD